MKAYERDHEMTKLGRWVLAGVLLLILVVGVYLGSGWYYLREKAEAAYQECLVYDTVLREVLGTADAAHQDGLAAFDSWVTGDLTDAQVSDLILDAGGSLINELDRMAKLGDPPEGLRQVTELLKEATGDLFIGYGRAAAAIDPYVLSTSFQDNVFFLDKEFDEEMLQEGSEYIAAGAATLDDVWRESLEANCEAA